MESARRNSTAFHRSASSPNVHSLAPNTESAIRYEEDGELPRSASYTTLSSMGFDMSSANGYLDAEVYIKPLDTPDSLSRRTSIDTNESKPDKPQGKISKAPKTSKSGMSGWMGRIMGKNSSRDSSPLRLSTSKRSDSSSAINISRSPSMAKLKGPKTKNLADNYDSGSPLSRSPSPTKKSVLDLTEDYTTPASSITSISPKSSSTDVAKLTENEANGQQKPSGSLPSRKGSVLLRRPSKAAIGLSERFQADSTAKTPIVTAIAQQQPVTDAKSKGLRGKMSGLRPSTPQVKDELWPMYKNLDGDYQKFVAKTNTYKVGEINKTLLPFLRNHHYQNHPSTKTICPTQLERRVNVLNKWWRAMLDMLRQNNGLSGHDRPAILEAIKHIMSRQEWRFGFTPTGSSELTPQSTGSSDYDSLTASVYANIQTIFVLNLRSQMNIVIQKISMRHAPANLIEFCGIATTYAFFFCPRIAHALLQSWSTPLDTVKRVAEELGLPRRAALSGIPDDINARFPECLKPFSWSSPKRLFDQIRKPVELPSNMEPLPKSGFWFKRWSGEETEFFFCFVREYYTLLNEFVSADATIHELSQTPGYVSVQAQIMTLIEAMVFKPAPVQDSGGRGPLLDDVLTRVNVSVAAAYPTSPTANASRSMSENRLIMLLRHFSLEDDKEDKTDEDKPNQVGRTFSTSFVLIMKAVAKKTSIFSNRPCFYLCDLIEEVLPIIANAVTLHGANEGCIDWQFWLKVWQKMLLGEDTVTIPRVFSLIFNLWETIKATDPTFEAHCMDWLLSESVFESFFLHWCPLVRAYYMRLLLWRICQDDGHSTEHRQQILHRVSNYLKAVYSHYQAKKQMALRTNRTVPLSNACDPIPQRKLIIDIAGRQQQMNRAPPPLVTFDDILNYGRANDNGSTPRAEPARTNAPTASLARDVSAVPRRRWSIMGSGPRRKEAPPVELARLANSTDLAATRQATAEARRRPQSMYGASSGFAPPPPRETASATANGQKMNFEFAFIDNFMSISERRAFQRYRSLEAPRLPTMRHRRINKDENDEDDTIIALADKGNAVNLGNKYAGSALAEWQNCVSQHDNFVEQRLSEGATEVEIPKLSIDAGLIRITKLF